MCQNFLAESAVKAWENITKLLVASYVAFLST